jgi:hypothetical protein
MHMLAARKALGMKGKSQRYIVTWYFVEGPGSLRRAA